MRQKIVAANWKMNGSEEMVRTLLKDVKSGVAGLDKGVEVVIIPPSLYLRDVQQEVKGSQLRLGAQNVARWQAGAYTGEVAAGMLSDFDCRYVLVGHSERRQLFAESESVVAEKLQQVLDANLNVMLCVGETLEQRQAGQAEQVVCEQLSSALAGLQGRQWQQVVVAYEPVWAIGTGKTATAEDAQSMHAVMRKQLAKLGAPAEEITLLYGGSVKPESAVGLFQQPDIDGGLIGGASLVAADFVEICKALEAPDAIS